MNRPPLPFAKWTTLLVAVSIVGVLSWMTMAPTPSRSEEEEVAKTFHFTKIPLPEVANHPPYKYVRKVHPNLKHIDVYMSTLGAAVAMGDLDGDGISNDVVHVDPRTDQVICAPLPGTPARFEPFALDPGRELYNPDTMCPVGCLITDLNEDGLMDVLVLYWGRPPIAFLRKTPSDPAARLTAEDFVAQEITPHRDRWYSSTATTADLDGDGHLDLILGNYIPEGSRPLDANASGFETMFNSLARGANGGGTKFFRWVGGTAGSSPTVRYEEQTAVLPESMTTGWTLAVGAVDLDGDGLPEVYLANDFGPDHFLHNRSTPGHFRFTPMHGERKIGTPASCVMGADSFKGMGVDFGDINGDGLLDIFVSNLASKYSLQESHFLWLCTGDLGKMKEGVAPYIQASERYGLSRSGWAWDARMLDLNNDGILEVIQANGFIKGKINRWPELQSLALANTNVLHDPSYWPKLQEGCDVSGQDTFAFFIRAKDGRYYDMAPRLGLSEAEVNRGIAVADVDGDGRLDFAVANMWEPSYLYHNDSPNPGNFLGLRLMLPLESDKPTRVLPGLGHAVKDNPGRPAVGALVSVELPDKRKRVSLADGGSGFSGKRSPDVHIGLGDLKEVPVTVSWRDPGGHLREEKFQLKAGWHTVYLGWQTEQKEERP
jgi:enediyne biosynthesis protein E4